MTTTAPLYWQSAQAPADGRALWITAEDGVRLRLALWGEAADSPAGTILFFPGRTEFVEKYGRTVTDLRKRGFAAAVIDWRGQGLSDRLTDNRQLGHVERFADYQRDVAAMLAAAQNAAMPRPWFLLAHSMGGTIALRALLEGLPVEKSVLSAPMFGLTIDPLWRPLVQALAAGTASVGLGQEFAPGTGPENYLSSAAFDGNVLTSSQDSWAYMQRLIADHPGLEIGGPSIHWIHEALTETRALTAMDPPADMPMLALVGSEEKVVSKSDILNMAARWPGAQVLIVTGARHEILIETRAIRKRAHDMIDAFLKG